MVAFCAYLRQLVGFACLLLITGGLPLLPEASGLLAATYPDPVGYVSDFANVISPEIEAQITEIATELREKTEAEIAVASFPNMDGNEIDDFTVKLFEQWMPGKKGLDNGILIVNAIEERKVRIEIGYGLEGVLNDARAGDIRRDVMTPLLKEGNYGEAYLAGVAAIASIIATSQNVTLESLQGQAIPRARSKNGPSKNWLSQLIIFAVVMVVIALSNRGRRRGGRFTGGTPWIGGGGFGGWSGGGGGGGGFGGFGGGGSGGGGSSGGY